MKPIANPVSESAIREAVDDVISGGPGARLEAVAEMSVVEAKRCATRVLLEKGDAAARVDVYKNGPWLYVEPLK
jgi:hypothetical protein